MHRLVPCKMLVVRAQRLSASAFRLRRFLVVDRRGVAQTPSSVRRNRTTPGPMRRRLVAGHRPSAASAPRTVWRPRRRSLQGRTRILQHILCIDYGGRRTETILFSLEKFLLARKTDIGRQGTPRPCAVGGKHRLRARGSEKHCGSAPSSRADPRQHVMGHVLLIEDRATLRIRPASTHDLRQSFRGLAQGASSRIGWSMPVAFR